MPAERIVVAMSGGVDSSLAAYLLKEAGYEVIGITMQIWPNNAPASHEGGCCSLAAVSDARRVADQLDIAYYVLNMQEAFEHSVIRYFVDEYRRGRTPNPCIACNRYLKFDLLIRKALALEAEAVATGHYARIRRDESGRYQLLRAVDESKDQSYALYPLTQEQLARIRFPLGDYRKSEIRKLAARLGLATAGKPESQEICFIHDNDYRRYLRQEAGLPDRPGPIEDRRGRRLGTHRGIEFYTIGQRRGLGLAHPEPLYVIDIIPERNAVVVGTADETLAAGLEVGEVNYVSVPRPWAPTQCQAKIRYGAPPVDCLLQPIGEGARVEFGEPQRAVTPGQAVVFYQGDLVLAGGTIERALH
ncbi:MAG: tRNA 2-thiouridine(34) synthase MnmA [Bacillota bacterium]